MPATKPLRGLSPHVCARCAAQGTACCKSSEGVSGPPLTPGDIERISTKSGLSGDRFVARREVDAVEQSAWEEEDPAARGLVRDGMVSSLARRGDDCFFLAETGCTLGEAKPLLCKRFPLRAAPGGKQLEVKPGGYCLAVEEASDLPALLVLLGTSKKELRAIDRQLAAELR